MNVNILTLCDFAQDNNGKLTIVGVYDLIVAKKVPFKKHLFFVARICFDAEDCEKKHNLKVTIFDEKKQEALISPVTNELPIEENKKKVYCNLIFDFGNLAFPSDGIYNFKLEVDGKEFSTSLNVELEKDK